MEDLQRLLEDAEASAVVALEKTTSDELLASTEVLKDIVLFVLDVLGQVDGVEAQQAAVAVLRRILVPNVSLLQEARQLRPANSREKANPVLKALLSTLTALTTKSDVQLEVIQGVVSLVHELCLSSMTSADVLLLFEHVRVARPPARRLILQMQRALVLGETTPRAVFRLKGDQASIVAPPAQVLFSKKGYTFSLGLQLDPIKAAVVSLYSFRGSNGQGVSCLLEGMNLVVRMHGGNGSISQVTIPFADWREKMQSTWLHLCIVHTKKMVFKDKLTVFVDGAAVFNGNLPYPDPLCMVGGQHTIGVIPSVASFQGKIWSPTLFGQPLGDAEVQKLHWLTHWKNDLSSVAAENSAMSDKSKFIFSYDARSCDLEKRICYDVSGNDCHGWTEGGTSAFVTQGLRQALDSVGGSSCFLLLLLDQIPEMADFHPRHEFSMEEISDLLSFVGTGLQSSVVCRSHFIRLRGVNVLAFIIQSMSPQYLTVDVLDSVVMVLGAVLENADPEKTTEYALLLLFQNTNWFLAPFETQLKLLGDILPQYLEVLEEAHLHESRRIPGGATAGAMEALGLSVSGSIIRISTSVVCSNHKVDVNFFCNLMVQLYSRKPPSETESSPSFLNSTQQDILRKLIVHNLIDRLLIPASPEEDLRQWRQLFAHLYRRAGKVTAESYANDGDGVEMVDILVYLTKLLVEPAHSQSRSTVIAKMTRLSGGTSRLWWRMMSTPVTAVRLETLRLFEAYCSDRVVLKRRDFLMLVSSCQRLPITMETADSLLDLVIGRKHTSSNNASSPSHAIMRSMNVSRLGYLPMVLLALVSGCDAQVRAHILYEVRVLVASLHYGEIVKEAIRSWPPWLGRLRAIVDDGHLLSPCHEHEVANLSQLSEHELNHACAVLSDDQSPLSARLDAIQAIGTAQDTRGCDFVLSLIQNSAQPPTVTKAIASMVTERFASRCPVLASRLSNQIIADVTVYSILNVRNGWIHFLEFYFAHHAKPSELCGQSAIIVDKLSRWGQSQRELTSPAENTEVIWENLPQVAAILTLIPRLTEEMRGNGHLKDADMLSPGQRNIITRKAFDLWTLVLPRLHLINWEQMKSLLLQNANYGQGISISEKAIFCCVIAEAPHLRFLVLQNTLLYLQSAQQSNESHASLIGNAMKVLEVLRIGMRPSPTTSPTSPRLSSSPPTSATACGLYPGIVSRITEAKDFVGDIRCVEAQIPREVFQLCTLDVLSKVLSKELSGARCFKSASLLVEMMVIVASTIMQLQNSSTDGESLPDVLKTLQIMASTDLTFFHDCDQLQELATLWQLHRESHSSFCDSSVLEREIQFQNSAFVDRWMYVIENHGVEFNPFLIQKDATIQASMLGEEMLASEMLWQEVLDDASAATAAALEAEGEEEGRLTVLKQEAEKFAGSVHKLILHTIRETSPADDTNENLKSGVAQETGETNKADNVGFMEGFLWKVDSKENAYRMRLRLKRVKENYRLRNLSCEFAGSSLQDEDQKGGRSGPRRFKSARDSIGGGAVIDIDRSWRSDAGSDYSDFFADAQMRAAIIRSCPSVGGRDSFAGELSDEDEDLDDVDDTHAYDSDEDATFEEEAQAILSEELHAVDTAPIEEKPLEEFLGSSDDLRAPSSPPTSQSDTLNQAPKAKVESPKSPLLGGFGASVLSGLSGVAELVQKAAKDAKEAMEYGVDSLYTARDALTDETQSLVQEVSTLIDSSKPPASSKTANHVESGLSPTSADCRRLSISIADPPSDATPQLFPSSPPQVHSRHRSGEGKPARRGSGSSKRELSFEASLVRHMNVVGGKLVLTGPYVYFIAERVIDEHENVLAERKKGVPIESAWRFLFKRRRWLIDDVSSLYRRRYLLKPTAIEIFIHSTRKNYFFSMSMDDLTRFHEALMMRRPMLLRRDPTMRRLRHPSNIFRNSTMSVRWMNHEISTFEYLMWLNTTAGRTYNDLTQYPVFPWVIADYESSSLDLSRASTFRDLSKPIGALEPTRLKFFLDRYNSFEDSDIPKFLYGTHYSNIGVVLYYLIRLEPFTSYALSVQGGKFDHADRLFQSVADTWQNCLHDFNDLKELTPEWYYLPDFLKNCNGLDLGVKQNGVVLGDVVLPQWAKSAEDFVIKNLTALESEYASANIHRWIDLVFGYNQRGPAAIAANNVFFYLTYEGMVDIDSITDPIIKSSMRAQIAHFGQTPTQVLRDPHPARSQLLTKKSSRSGPLMASPPERAASPLSKATLSSDGGRSTLLFLPHDYPITLLHLAPGASSMLCADNHGQVSVHRYGGKSVKVHHTPFLNDLSSTATKASGVFKTPKQAASSSSFVDLPSDLAADYIELHDRKSRKVIAGDKILTAAQYSINNYIAFMNAGAVYCTVGHHDFSARFYSSSDGALLYRLLQHHSVVTCLGTSTNGSLLALGSTDGTISVWKVTNIASTLLDSIKIFRGSKSNSRPVHAHDYAADQVLLGHASSINCVALSEDLGVCISGSSSNDCLAHNLDDGSIEQQYKVPGTDAPGILSLALSPVGLVLVQSMGTGVPMLYCFHLNGKFMAGVALGERPMTSLSVCTRYSKVIVSNQEEALTFSAHDLEDKHVLLSKEAYGDIHTHSLSPDETHVVFGVGIAKVISLSLIPNPSQEKS